jgi:hypothetical protein
MNKNALITIVVILAIALVAFFALRPAVKNPALNTNNNLDNTPVENGDTNTGDNGGNAGAGSTLPEGGTTFSAKLGQEVLLSEVTGKVTEVLEDSRCPQDVQCIQAGTVRVKAHLTFGTLSQDVTLKLGEPVVFSGHSITLIDVKPTKVSTVQIKPADYVFTFKVQ